MEPIHGRHPSMSRAGTTITELMVAVIILSVGCLGLFGAFRYISVSLNVSRSETLAANLAQERVETLKNLDYYGLLITTSTAYDTRFNPQIPYDTGNYPPEVDTIGNLNFTRYTYVTMADVTSGSIVSVGSDYPDTGLKQMVVNVVWTTTTGQVKKYTLTNLLENPSVNPLDATMTGTVFIAGGGGALASAKVFVEQDPDWSGTTNVGGAYSFQVYHGTYTVRVSSAGFYDSVSSTTVVARGATVSTSLSLEKISSGTVSGVAWYNPSLVISQVVASTVNAGTGYDTEYVELFNPTTASINIGTGGSISTPGTPIVTLSYGNGAGNYCASLPLVYSSTYVAPGHYYLVASSSIVLLNGANIAADAYYTFGNPGYHGNCANWGGSYWSLSNGLDIMGLPHSGLVWLTDPLGNTLDAVGWTDGGAVNQPDGCSGRCTASCNGTCIQFPVGGLVAGEQIVRVSSPSATLAASGTSIYGRAYNSQNNSVDFFYPTLPLYTYGIQFPPLNTAAGTFPVISGQVPNGVVVSASDDHSSSLTAAQVNITSGALSLPYVPFQLTGVTTGTYSVALSYTSGSNVYSQILSNVLITQNQTIAVPNAATLPAWSPANFYQVQLTSTPDTGFVKGIVTDPNNNPVNGITVQSGGYTKVTGANGSYFMNVSSGDITLVANPNNSNGAYVQVVNTVTVAQGAVATQNIVLSLGARLTGYCTTGTTPVPNQVVTASVGGNQVGTGTSDATGLFSIRNMSTGTYTIQPVLNLGQSSDPVSVGPITVTSTGSVFVGTFTVNGSYGSIGGTVTDNSALVTTGALIIASTNTITSTPPSIAASSAPAQTPYYMISSKADGTYSLPVRGGSTYNLSAYIPTVSAAGVVSITTKTYTGVAVSVGGNVTKNVVLP